MGARGEVKEVTNRQEIVEANENQLLVKSKMLLRPFALRWQDILFHWSEFAADHVFLAERDPGSRGWRAITYAQAADQVRRIATALFKLGLNQQRPLLVLSENSISHQLIALGAMTAGVPYSAVSTAYSLASSDHSRLKYILSKLNPGAIFAEDAASYHKALALPEMAERQIVVAHHDRDVGRAVNISALLEYAPDAAAHAAFSMVTSDHIAKILFTSGSTGYPKGVLTTHRMLCSNIEMLSQVWPFLEEAPPIFVDWLPWNHVFGGSAVVGCSLRHAGTLYIDRGRPIPGQFDATIQNLREVAPTVYFNVPKGYEMLIPELSCDPAFAKHFFSRLRVVFYSGATLPPHLWAAIEELAREYAPRPVGVMTGWGLTETAPAITQLERSGASPGSIGGVLPGQTLKLVRSAQRWEARVRGPNVTSGYLNMPVETAAAFDEDGFFRTGDEIAFVDVQVPDLGFRFLGRTTEDFKLSSGIFVDVSSVKARVASALKELASDVVIIGPDQEYLCALVFPHVISDCDRTLYRARLRRALSNVNHGFDASSRQVKKVAILWDPLTLDSGEITDKGSINAKQVRTRRAHAVDGLYSDRHGEDIIEL